MKHQSILMKCRFTPFNLSPDVCRPGVWCDELDHSLGCGSFLLRRSQRLHPGLLQVSDCIPYYFFFCRHFIPVSSAPIVTSLIAALLHIFLCLEKAVLRGLQRGPPARLPVHDPYPPLHPRPRPALQRQSTLTIFYFPVSPQSLSTFHSLTY